MQKSGLAYASGSCSRIDSRQVSIRFMFICRICALCMFYLLDDSDGRRSPCISLWLGRRRNDEKRSRCGKEKYGLFSNLYVDPLVQGGRSNSKTVFHHSIGCCCVSASLDGQTLLSFVVALTVLYHQFR